MPTVNLCNELLKQYQCQTKQQQQTAVGKQQQQQQIAAVSNNNNNNRRVNEVDDEYLVAKKRRVVKFVRCWMLITREHFFQQTQIQSFLTVSQQTRPAE